MVDLHDDMPLDDRKAALKERLSEAAERIEADWDRIQSMRFIVTVITDENKLEVDTGMAGRGYADKAGLVAALTDELDGEAVAMTVPLAELLQASLEALEEMGLNTKE